MVRKLAIGCGGLFLLFVVIGIVGSSQATKTGPSSTTAPVAVGSVQATTPARAAPTAAPTSRPTPSPIVLRGTGQTATDPITLPGPASVATFTHSGRSNFIVKTFRAGALQNVLINRIGSYSGSRPLTGTTPVSLNIEADGAWTLSIAAIECCASSAAFVGQGDAVSSQFNAPSASTWDFSHDGKSNFIVFLHCATGDQVIQNRIGAFQGSAITPIPPGQCYWEVQADGNWSLKPR